MGSGDSLVLSRLRSGPPTHLCSLLFKGQGALPMRLRRIGVRLVLQVALRHAARGRLLSWGRGRTGALDKATSARLNTNTQLHACVRGPFLNGIIYWEHSCASVDRRRGGSSDDSKRVDRKVDIILMYLIKLFNISCLTDTSGAPTRTRTADLLITKYSCSMLLAADIHCKYMIYM